MRKLPIAIAACVFVAAGSAFAQTQTGPSRVNFDERLIKGQTTKAGSVYIFERQQIAIDSLVSRKRNFKQRVIQSVFEN